MSKVVYLIIALAIAGQIAIHYPDLPDRVASHFDAAGQPNDFMSKNGFVGFYVGIATFVLALFGSMPALIRRLPPTMVNMPNREYWLAPERLEESLTSIGFLMDVFSLGLGVFLVAIFELNFQAAISGGQMPPPWTLFGAFAAFVVGWIVAWLRRFGKTA